MSAATSGPVTGPEHETDSESDWLWPHQREAVDAAAGALVAGGRVTVVMACGTGKTRAAAVASARLAPRGRVLVVVPTLELLYQAAHTRGSMSMRLRPRCGRKTSMLGGITARSRRCIASCAITASLAQDYAMEDTALTRLPIGQCTVNYRARWRGRDYFVKHYPIEADLEAEARAIDLTDLAARHQVPTPPLVRTRGGQTISRRGISVWEWIQGHPVTDGFTPAQQQAAGQALGRIHRAFADHPNSAAASRELESWLHPDLAGTEATIADLLTHIAQRDQRDDFDQAAEQTLPERRHALREVPALLDGLPTLTTQVLHGDYSPVNLLFDGAHLSAVTDFRPPEPFLVAYELGRIAFDPRTVLFDADWITAASRLVTAYLEVHPAVRGEDVRACARVALLQLLNLFQRALSSRFWGTWMALAR